MSDPFKVVYADPPWQFGDRLPGGARGADKHYATMSRQALINYPIGGDRGLADDCVLFMWRVASMQGEALSLIHAWGFQPPTTELVWVKKTIKGNRWFGMGRITRAEHEVCLIAKRGRPQVKAKNVRTVFEAINYRHSEKPEVMYSLIESLYDGPYIELFARDVVKPRQGWTYHGDER